MLNNKNINTMKTLVHLSDLSDFQLKAGMIINFGFDFTNPKVDKSFTDLYNNASYLVPNDILSKDSSDDSFFTRLYIEDLLANDLKSLVD